MKPLIEIGHFYLNENTEDVIKNKLIYLNYYIKTNLFIDNTPCLFIDDVHIDIKTLNVNKIKNYIKDIIKVDIQVFYESDMINHIDLLYDKLKCEIKTKRYNKENKIKEQILFNDKLYTISETYPNFKLTCLGYSLIWSLYRTKYNITYTLISKRFQSIEDIVKFYIPENKVLYY